MRLLDRASTEFADYARKKGNGKTYRTVLLSGAVCTALGAVGSTISRSVFDPVAFGDRAAASLSDPRVATYAADRITDAVLERSPDLTAVRPLILGAAEGLAASEPMRGLVRAGARSAPRDARRRPVGGPRLRSASPR